MTTLAVLADMTARPNRSPWISSPPIVRLTAGPIGIRITT